MLTYLHTAALPDGGVRLLGLDATANVSQYVCACIDKTNIERKGTK